MISGGIEVDQFAQLCLILENKIHRLSFTEYQIECKDLWGIVLQYIFTSQNCDNKFATT